MVLRKLFSVDAATNGKGPAIFAWSPNGNYLAVVGANRLVTITDRQGKKVWNQTMTAQAQCLELAWDCESDVLAVLQQGMGSVTLLSVGTRKVETLESGVKDLTMIRWSKTDNVLAIGNAKGGIVIYNKDTFKKEPVLGLHSKKIIDMRWNRNGQLALSSEDRTLTITDNTGAKLETVNVKGDASCVRWADRKFDKRSSGKDQTISMISSGKTLMFHQVQTKDGVVELAFNKNYGPIVAFEWYGDGYVVLGFQNGTVTVVSTHPKEIGGEISNMKSHRDHLNALTVNGNIAKGAAVGDNFVRVFDLSELKLSDQTSERYEFDSEFGALTHCEWSQDGQILTVGSKTGNVYSFLTSIPVINDAWGPNVLYMSSLRELLVRDVMNEADVATISVDIEPAFVALGKSTAAVGMNNQVYYYEFDPAKQKQQATKTKRREYPTIVESVKVSHSYAAVLMQGGKAVLHMHEENHTRPQVAFPDKDPTATVMSHGMTEHFYICGASNGTVTMFSLSDHQSVCEYRHACGIRHLQPNIQGTRIAWIDTANHGVLFNPATEVATAFNKFNSTTERLIWDPSDHGTIVGVDPKAFTTYVYSPNTRYGSTVHAMLTNRDSDQALTTSRPFGFIPILAYRGVVVCQMPAGNLQPVNLKSHEAVSAKTTDAATFDAYFQLNRLVEASSCTTSQDQTTALAERALHLLDIDLAVRLYRQLNKPTVVQCLESIRHIHEKNVLLGYVCMMLHQFNDAQTFFTRSSNPNLALEMRRDLMHWDHALQLAQTLAPDQIPTLSREYGQTLELRGEYTAALEMFQRGQVPVPNAREDSPLQLAARAVAQQQNEACMAGCARCLLRVGNVREGMQAALNATSDTLRTDCAAILESMKQFEEAATLYERANQYERAATIYINETKQLKSAQRLLPKITSRNVLVMYAKAKEMEAAYADAAAAYEQAEDWDNVVRVKVNFLKDLHAAYIVVRKTRSTEAAALVAGVCKKRGEFKECVEFLLLAKKTNEAFDVAKNHNVMTAFETALLAQSQLKDGVAVQNADRENFVRIAQHYEDKGNHEIAGDFYQVGGNFAKALGRFLHVGSEEYIDKAIQTVGKARSDALTHKLLDYLMGEQDGEPKNPNCIFRLYMALKNYEKAAKTAVLIANKEQELGEYRAAHKILIDTALVLQERSMRIPGDLLRALMLLHSYLIVKHLVKPMEEHVLATRMLLRVARNIQKFPLHAGAILTSATVKAIKTEFHASAYKYACMLVQTEELRSQIPDSQKRKIEQVVRKRTKEELLDPTETTTQCPFCQNPVDETALDCMACKNKLPFCIVTGRHMVASDWTECPKCRFPAGFDAFLKLLRFVPQCPLCEQGVDPMSIEKMEPDMKQYHERFT